MKIFMRNRVIDLDDELDVMFACEYFSWDEYTRMKTHASNIAERDNVKKYKNSYLKRFKSGRLDSTRNNIEVPAQEFNYVSDDKCVGKIENDNDNLIIYTISHAGIENRMNLPIIGLPDRIYDLKDRFDIVCLNEHPFRFPEILYPSNLVLGCSDKNNTFDKMINSIKNTITKSYKKVIVFGDSKHAAISLSISHALSDIVTNVFIIHGQTSYAWNDSGWVQPYLKYLEKRQNIFEKTGYIDNTMAEEIPGAQLYHIIKSYMFNKMNIDDRVLSPFKYHNEYNIKIDYIYNKYDHDHMHFADWLLKNATGNINFHKLEEKSHNPHFIRPHVERKILPKYINEILNA